MQPLYERFETLGVKEGDSSDVKKVNKVSADLAMNESTVPELEKSVLFCFAPRFSVRSKRLYFLTVLEVLCPFWVLGAGIVTTGISYRGNGRM